MLPDRVSNPGSLTYESGALSIALRGPAMLRVEASFHRQYSKFMPLLISDILSALSQVKVINKIGTLSYFLF